MPYLIDGHNLIPKISFLDLRDLDDEIKLIELLQVFCQQYKKTVEVFFDQASPGQPRVRNYGRVKARFIHSHQQADAAIEHRILQLGKGITNWCVVSSDRRIQTVARAVRAKFLSSEAFANQLEWILNKPSEKPDTNERNGLSENDLDEWLQLFDSGKNL